MMNVTAFDIAQVFVGEKETAGVVDNPLIVAMLRTDAEWPSGDEVPWCSGFVNFVCKLLRLPRSYDLRARSWLGVGRGINLLDARPGFDVVVLSRTENSPGPEVIDAPGHVGFYAGHDQHYIEVLGGNQGDSVKVSRYPKGRLLGVRRLYGGCA